MRQIAILMLLALAGCASDKAPHPLGPGQVNHVTLGTDFSVTPKGRMTPTPYPGVDLL